MRTIAVVILCTAATATAQDVKRFTLPGRASQMVVGGEGRYLALAIRKEKLILVVDLSSPAIEPGVKTSSDRFCIAANRSELVVADATTSKASRYKLADLGNAGPAVLFPGKIGWMGMGAASDGPLWTCLENYAHMTTLSDLSISDPKTFRKVQHIEKQTRVRQIPLERRKTNQAKVLLDAAVSDDGTTFVDSYRELAVQIRGNHPTTYAYEHPGGAPSFDGDLLLTVPPFAVDQKPPGMPLSGHQLLHGVGSNLFAVVEPDSNELVVTAYDLSQYTTDRIMPKPLGSVTLPRLPPLQTEKDSLGYPLSVPEMQFSPKQGVVARLEKEGMELVLYPIELSQGWNDANFAAAIPKIGFCAARLSQPIDYQVSVPAGCQLKQCRLIIGPKGMSVTQQGRLEWTAPPKADSQAISALIEVATADDSIATHLVVITVGPASAIDSRGNPMMRPGVTPLHAYQPMSIGDLQGIGPDIDRTGIVRLPSKVKGVALAGGGNYLIIEMPELEMLGVFDVLAGQIVAYLANFPDVFTASSDSIILVERPSPAGDRRLRSIERWLVPDLKRADKAQPDESVAPWGLAMGNNDNQLLLVKSSRLGRENLHRFDAADLSRTNSIPMSGNVDQRVDEFRVSGDGNLIVWRMRGVAKIFIYGQAADESWRSLEYESESKLAMPTTDGRRIVLDHEVLQLSDDAKSVKATPLGSRMLATAEGSLGLGVPAHLSLSGRPANRLDVVNLKTGKAVGAIDGLFEFDDPESQSVWLLPEQGWLLQLDPSRTMLLRKSVKLSSR